MLVGVSTGVLYPHINSINRQIQFFRESKLDIDGLELSFDRSGKVMDATKSGRLNLTSKNEEYLKQLKFNTIHLPWVDVAYSETELRFLSVLSELCKRLKSSLVTIHPDRVKRIETYQILQKYFPNLCVENMPLEDKYTGCSIEEVRAITDKSANLGVVLDFAHCMDSNEAFEDYEKAFYPKLREIHISASSKALNQQIDISRHILLCKTAVRPVITKQDVPLIIEGRTSSIEELKNEIEVVRKL